jgi:osmotically-inducible protein OsmY
MDDLKLRQTVLDELEFEPSLKAAHIGVAVDDGVVTLTGRVGSYAEKVIAEEAVRRVKGVKAIAQEISVRLHNDKKTSDDQIAGRALRILSWQNITPESSLQLKVDNGLITLRGEVDWQFQKIAAEQAVGKLTGVVGITNLISLRPHVSAADIQSRVERALKRNAKLDADRILVRVSGGRVTLDGKVGVWSKRGIAEQAAWAVPGVIAVEDHLDVG